MFSKARTLHFEKGKRAALDYKVKHIDLQRLTLGYTLTTSSYAFPSVLTLTLLQWPLKLQFLLHVLCSAIYNETLYLHICLFRRKCIPDLLEARTWTLPKPLPLIIISITFEFIYKKWLDLYISMNRRTIARNYLRIPEERMYRGSGPGLAKVDPPPPPPGDKDFGILN